MTSVLCDVDGVLADCVGHVFRLHHRSTGEQIDRERMRTYSFRESFGQELGCSLEERMRAPGFWVGLDPYPDAAGAVA